MNNNWHQEETYKSLMLYGNNALKFVLLINGGAVIALLTFLGNLLKNTTNNNMEIDMSWAMGCFLLGIIVGGIANLTAYFAQLKLYNESIGNTNNTTHMKWVYTTLGLIIFGIILFTLGAILTLNELQSYK